MSLDKIICDVKSTLIDAWKQINENAKHTVFIVDDNKVLKGVMTDGDIRRYLIKGGNMNEMVEKFMNKDYIAENINTSINELIKKTSSKIKIIPLVDDNNRLVDFFEYGADFYLPVAQPSLKGNEINYLLDAFLSTWISSRGEYINKFEKKFSKYIGYKHGVAVSNGTVALHLAMLSLNIGEGDEVIIPDLTFAATINAVLHAGATPVIVDVEMDSWCVNPIEIEKAITKKTKAIIPVHIYGQPCDMDSIMKIANKHSLFVIEDCAEAHGAEYKGKKVGSFGTISCFSFFANKIITTGEGGMCLTEDKKLDEKMRLLRDHGMSKSKKYYHDMVGYNYRLTNLQASIGVAQLERINEILFNREDIENEYKEKLSFSSSTIFQANNLKNRKKVTWLVSLLTNKNRDDILEKLQQNGIDARPFFYPLSEMEIYSKYALPTYNSKLISKKGLNLATNNLLNEDTYNRIIEVFKEFE